VGRLASDTIECNGQPRSTIVGKSASRKVDALGVLGLQSVDTRLYALMTSSLDIHMIFRDQLC